MPRTTKDVKINDEKDGKSKAKKSTTATKKSSTTKTVAKKSTTKKTEKVEPKTKTTKKATAQKASATKNTSKKETVETKKASTKKTATKKSATTSKKTTAKKSTSTKKKTGTSTTRKRSTAKSKILDETIVAEYYDLPYRYNETVVKILYQTPTILFVYWDISDYDRENFVNHYGQNFFNNTRPILKIYNLTKNYDFEVEINDFANSWYINVNDANCEYKVELARRTIRYEENINTDYIYVSTSNNIEFPNDHILLEELPNKVRFKNVKTNSVSTKDISTLHLIGINKIYNAHDFYKGFYKDEIFEEINSNKIINPSSSSWK